MTIVQKARAANGDKRDEIVTRTDLSMRLAAVGGRGALLEADEAGGIDLALKADAFYVEDGGRGGLERGRHDGGGEPGAACARRRARVRHGQWRDAQAVAGARAAP